MNPKDRSFRNITKKKVQKTRKMYEGIKETRYLEGIRRKRTPAAAMKQPWGVQKVLAKRFLSLLMRFEHVFPFGSPALKKGTMQPTGLLQYALCLHKR